MCRTCFNHAVHVAVAGGAGRVVVVVAVVVVWWWCVGRWQAGGSRQNSRQW